MQSITSPSPYSFAQQQRPGMEEEEEAAEYIKRQHNISGEIRDRKPSHV